MTHFLDVKGKIADLEAILKEYEIELAKAEARNDTAAVERLQQAIEETENKIAGMLKSPYYKG